MMLKTELVAECDLIKGAELCTNNDDENIINVDGFLCSQNLTLV